MVRKHVHEPPLVFESVIYGDAPPKLDERALACHPEMIMKALLNSEGSEYVNSTPGKPTPEQKDTLVKALRVLTMSPFTQIDSRLFALLKPMRLELNWKMEEPVTTWMPKGSLFFTLVRTDSATVVYSHVNDTAYYATDAVRLSLQCPTYTAFLAQWVEDRDGAGIVPRLLVFDIADAAEKDPARRGERLRSLSHCLPRPLCEVQWAGVGSCLFEFVKKLPHEVVALLALGKDPCCLQRMPLLQIPPNPMSQIPIVELNE